MNTNNLTSSLLGCALFILLGACSGGNTSSSSDNKIDKECSRLSSAIKDATKALNSDDEITPDTYKKLYDNLDVKLSNIDLSDKRKDSLESVSEDAKDEFISKLMDKWIVITNDEEKLLYGKTVYPIRLCKGDELKVEISSSEKISFITVRDYRTGNIIASDKNKSEIALEGAAKNSSIYLVSFDLDKKAYTDIKISRKVGKKDKLFESTDVKTSTVECKSTDKGAYAKNIVEMKNLYQEPIKATLASQGRAIFGNKSKVIVSVQLPKGSSGFFYRLRLSSSKEADGDGQLSDELISFSSDREIGPIKTSHNMSVKSPFVQSVLSSLSSPKCEEEIYCSFYVFKGAKEARKFQDGSSYFVYNIDNSIQNTQSTNGFVPSQGLTSYYIGLSNSRFTTSIYVWLEVVAAIPTTKYYKELYE